MGRKVLKFDSPSGAEGCGIALAGDEYEVSVTFLPPPACQGEGDRVSGGRGWLQSSHSPAPHGHSEPLEWYSAVLLHGYALCRANEQKI